MRAAHDPRYLEFVARIRSARKARHMTQAELARLLGKPQAFVSKVETCERRLDLIETAEWCIQLKIRLYDLIPGELEKSIEGFEQFKERRH